MAASHILGIDIGSVSVSVAEVNRERQVAGTTYEFHYGDVAATLNRILARFDLRRIGWVAATTSTPSVVRATRRYDNRVSVIAACRHFHPEFGAILLVGGEKFGLLRFDERGDYVSFRANTSCAAGTGSFLDQQARRLNLRGPGELSEIASGNTGVVPKIASRCAVFAKTDLVHAQQEGYSLEEICEGLCHGLAKNIVDTLFVGDNPRSPIIFSGGVSRNRSVVEHIRKMVDAEFIVEKWPYGAVGAALNLLDELQEQSPSAITSNADIITSPRAERKYAFPPLKLNRADYPDFGGSERYEFSPPDSMTPSVEVDVYQRLDAGQRLSVHLGVDIGSTSTKAVIVDESKKVLAGLYTRTAGRPVKAVQSLFAALDDLVSRKGVELQIGAAGTTGSGRKFSGKIIGADLIVDEITAHARAAIEINPNVDTIIEIGGQDSKFTTLKNGIVTFSVMNTVCAAGTGSFIEEQAQKFNCPLSEFPAMTEGQRSPAVSDRCTVFMERDMNHYLSEGYSLKEALAAVLHAITENYLTKVASENSIGDIVFFQGATAKNKALVAALEQRLGKPLHVSEYCHLTGALGAALMLIDQDVPETTFKGLDLHRKNIPIRSEVCELCTNHCKLTVAQIDEEVVAYGFLCGRDYDTRKQADNNRSGFDLLKTRKKAFSFTPRAEYREDITIGLPAALHLYDDLPLWRKFFDELSIRTVTSEGYAGAMKAGAHLAGAEFCAPMTAMYGHIDYALDKSDYVFFPFYLERKARQKGVRRQYCYYTQYAPALASSVERRAGREEAAPGRLLRPLVHYLYNRSLSKLHIYRALKPVLSGLSFSEVSAAYDTAVEFKEVALSKLKGIYDTESRTGGDIHVVLLGRPYTVTSESMNKGVPTIFASLGVKAFFQDMVPYDGNDVARIEPLLKEFHWYYAAEILKTTQAVARTEGAYPVLLTSFKCSPDSFLIDYFKKVMESHDKPYLILQLDEHDSSVGYETRIEAAIRAFRNHRSTERTPKPARGILPPAFSKRADLFQKTLILPNWDGISLRLVVANLRRAGLDARLLEPSDESIQKGLRHNTGQCIPLNLIAQDFIDYVERRDLDPARTVLWMGASKMACNLGLYPYHLKNLICSNGNAFEKAEVYAGGISFSDISVKLPVNTYFAFMFGGLIRKMGCKLRPYEKTKGATDRVIEDSVEILADAFSGHRPKEDAVAEVVSRFEEIDVERADSRPKAAIFGDLYARDNEVMNQGLVHFVEEHGGEVVTTPYSSYVRMITKPYLRKWLIEGNYFGVLFSKTLLATVTRFEKKYYACFERVLREPMPAYDAPPAEILSQYDIRIEHTGESMDNILKIFYLTKHYPDLALFIQTSPALCCPSLVTEAMAKQIEKKTGVPVVSVTYDGTGGNKNEVIIPYLKFPREFGVLRRQ